MKWTLLETYKSIKKEIFQRQKMQLTFTKAINLHTYVCYVNIGMH